MVSCPPTAYRLIISPFPMHYICFGGSLSAPTALANLCILRCDSSVFVVGLSAHSFRRSPYFSRTTYNSVDSCPLTALANLFRLRCDALVPAVSCPPTAQENLLISYRVRTTSISVVSLSAHRIGKISLFHMHHICFGGQLSAHCIG